MADPLMSLIISAAVAGLLALLFWPEGGLFWRWRRSRQLNERVLAEDALKHIYESQMEGRCPTPASVAAALELSHGRLENLLEAMQARGLLETSPEQICLTEQGQANALHVIRAHRLWERYLAEETGYQEHEWHDRAHRHEHLLTPADVEVLAARLNNPTHDPHGDPIPTADGQSPQVDRQPLNSLAAGRFARVVHLEDEPPEVYAQLVAEGIAPGTELRVLEATPKRVRFWADGDEHVLAPVVAANVGVVPALSGPAGEVAPSARLTSLKVGESATVAGIAPACRGSERRRFLDLGILPGTHIEAALASPSGNPVAYRVRGTLIALRHDQADHIQISRLAEVQG